MGDILSHTSGKGDGFTYSEANKIAATDESDKHLFEYPVDPKENR